VGRDRGGEYTQTARHRRTQARDRGRAYGLTVAAMQTREADRQRTLATLFRLTQPATLHLARRPWEHGPGQRG
jgi:hypothetical protein